MNSATWQRNWNDTHFICFLVFGFNDRVPVYASQHGKGTGMTDIVERIECGLDIPPNLILEEILSLRQQLAEDDRLLRASVPDRWKTCTSPVGAVQSYIAELEQQLAECLAALEKISEVDPSNSWSCQSGMAKEALAMAKERKGND